MGNWRYIIDVLTTARDHLKQIAETFKRGRSKTAAKRAVLVHGTIMAPHRVGSAPRLAIEPNTESASRKTKMYHGFKYVGVAGVNSSGRR